MVRFSKFTLNIKIYDEFVGFLSKLVWRETLFTSRGLVAEQKKQKRSNVVIREVTSFSCLFSLYFEEISFVWARSDNT